MARRSALKATRPGAPYAPDGRDARPTNAEPPSFPRGQISKRCSAVAETTRTTISAVLSGCTAPQRSANDSA